MLLVMRTPDALGRLLVPHHGIVVAPPRRYARLVVLGAAAGRVPLLDVLHARGVEGVRQYVVNDAVRRTC